MTQKDRAQLEADIRLFLKKCESWKLREYLGDYIFVGLSELSDEELWAVYKTFVTWVLPK